MASEKPLSGSHLRVREGGDRGKRGESTTVNRKRNEEAKRGRVRDPPFESIWVVCFFLLSSPFFFLSL